MTDNDKINASLWMNLKALPFTQWSWGKLQKNTKNVLIIKCLHIIVTKNISRIKQIWHIYANASDW